MLLLISVFIIQYKNVIEVSYYKCELILNCKVNNISYCEIHSRFQYKNYD